MSRRIVTKARILSLSVGDYLRIDYRRANGSEGDLTVYIRPSLTTDQSLKATAAEMREQAARLLRRANLIDQARAML